MSTESNAAAAQVGLERCERLLANADFQWFITQVTTRRRAAQSELEGLKTPKDARENAAHVRAALAEIETYVETQRDIYSRTAKK